jgi:hypothetical protein
MLTGVFYHSARTPFSPSVIYLSIAAAINRYVGTVREITEHTQLLAKSHRKCLIPLTKKRLENT